MKNNSLQDRQAIAMLPATEVVKVLISLNGLPLLAESFFLRDDIVSEIRRNGAYRSASEASKNGYGLTVESGMKTIFISTK